MNEELKWWEIERAVWERGPREKAQRAVLAQLAKHADADGYTFVGQPKIAERSGFAAITVKRAIAALELAGWFTVEERVVLVETRRGFEKKGNRYRLDLVKLGLAVAPVRAEIRGSLRSGPFDSAAPRSGPPVEMTGSNAGDEGSRPAGVTRSDEGGRPAARDVEGAGPVAGGDEGARPATKKHIGWSGAEGRPLHAMPARSHFERDEVSMDGPRGIKRGAPLINNSYPERQTERHPISSPAHCATAEKVQGGQVLERSSQPEQRKNLAGYHGGHCMQRDSRKSMRRERSPRDFAAARAAMDGEDAALWDEVSAVLEFCGVSPESSGRKQRQAVAQALRVYMREYPGASIADAGEVARGNWHEYRRVGPYLLSPMGVTGFFASGEWLNPQLWRFSLAGQEQMRRQANPW